MITTEKNPELTQLAEIVKNSSIDRIADLVHQNALEHGFHDPNQNEGDWLAHMCCNKHAEVTELYDAFRSGKLRSPCDKATKMLALGLPALNCAEEELADLVIRALDESRRLNIDIARAIGIKHAYNLTREHKHGKKS